MINLIIPSKIASECLLFMQNSWGHEVTYLMFETFNGILQWGSLLCFYSWIVFLVQSVQGEEYACLWDTDGLEVLWQPLGRWDGFSVRRGELRHGLESHSWKGWYLGLPLLGLHPRLPSGRGQVGQHSWCYAWALEQIWTRLLHSVSSSILPSVAFDILELFVGAL